MNSQNRKVNVVKAKKIVKVIATKKDITKEFENKLEILRKFVNSLDIKVYNGASDGRDVSKEMEGLVVDPIIDNFVWAVPKTSKRDIADFYIKMSKGVYFPVNVKLISERTNTYNNISGPVRTISKLLYGKNLSNMVNLATAIANNDFFTKEPTQYGILAVNKTTSETKVCTLFNISAKCLNINPSNGLQFDFNKLSTVKRTQLQGQKFLKDLFITLAKKKAMAYEILMG